MDRLILALIVFALTLTMIEAQNKTLVYTINRRGDAVGALNFTKSIAAHKTTLRLESDVNTEFVFNFLAEGIEESVFEHDILIRSSVYRELNGKEKANKATILEGSHYLLKKGTKQEVLSVYPIRYNLLCMYTMEPTNILKVYSDNFQEFFTIHRVGDHHYKVNFPDRNYTEYFYQNGVCIKMHVHHTLYEAMIELNK